MKLVFYTANCTGNAKNCSYPNRAEVTTAEELKAVVKIDHVCGEYKNNYRSADNFMESVVAVMDCDNDHSNNPDDWIIPEKIDELLPDVSYAIAPSRNHMKQKDDKTARPRFHVYFLINSCKDAMYYVKLKRRIQKVFAFFDDNALDAARFIFGADCDEVVWHDGWETIEEELPVLKDEAETTGYSSIPEGKRNNTLSRFAGRVVKRYSATEKAHQIFLEEAKKCDPPMEDEELTTIWNSAVKFAKKVEAQEGYVAPNDFNDDFTGEALKPSDFSDIGQAKVLAHEYRDKLCYTDATDYLRFNGKYWVESKQQAIGAMEEFLDFQLTEANVALEKSKKALLDAGVNKDLVLAGGKALEKAIDSTSEKAFKDYAMAMMYRTFVMKRRDMRYVTSALQAAKPMLLKNITDFDNNEFLLNTPSGTYDLQNGEVKEHSANDLITKITTSSPSNENIELWLHAIGNFFCHDKELIDYVQETVGLAAIGKVYQEALVIAYGEGSNGKSTFWNTIARVLGTYSGTISSDALTVGCKRNVKPEMAELKGKRLVIAAELEEGVRLNTSMVKQLCSTDEISAEKKYKDPFDYTPTHTLVLYTNHLPRVGANDDGTWRRLVVIPFNAKIERKSDIKNYSDYLVEKAGGAILTWIIDGAKRAVKNNFKLTEPPVVKEAVKHYRSNNDWLSIFIEDCCELDSSYSQKSGEFYQEYRAYCARNGEYTRSTTDFYAGLEIAGFKRKTIKHCRFVLGICLKSEFFAE
ncbi:phage/plasmid primase, P4 family [Clostridium grantii]|uniref:Phage/plasmid primase, P4 family, C-terminal domain-containing protein n=1 Tax=Clostridium grantii DSM 8605 TaxID=1121316 RepID=A0A1M5U797_9CLOT|nr:phage/plasmid primase, P4 family [Clostridium grantii]SHH58834.1 phage/plasmid primase, P4 family, C-terminal domain-containing protein [Clostridium grantii DSM 8605]